MVNNKNILFFYDYFFPGYKAGGPIQSLINLALALEGVYKISVITSAYDLHDSTQYKDITINTWNKVSIPGSKHPINVYYNSATLDKTAYQKILKEASPSVVYFNNIYSSQFFQLPLQALKSITGNYKIVICPRGMLQKGALAVKSFKKKIYLNYLRYTGTLNNAFWHATNEGEANDIKRHFPSNQGIIIASNIPKPPYSQFSFPLIKTGQLKLVYLSLIAEKKNLLLLLQLINASEFNIKLDIYGPVADISYWQQCEALIKQMPEKVRYKGGVQPVDVQQVLSQYHALILLTKGESFGHALYECLSVGRPIITSYFTPWNELQEKRAGLNVDISDRNDCLQMLSALLLMDQVEYNNYCSGAHMVAMEYYKNLDTEIKYKQLFS